MESGYYGTAEAARATGISRPALRAYTGQKSPFRRWLSTEAAPASESTPRRFTEQDLRLLAYIYQRTKAGARKDSLLAELEASAGALPPEFEWHPAEPEQVAEGEPAGQSASTMLITSDQASLLRAMVAAAEQRSQEAREREQQALEREKEARAAAEASVERERALQERVAGLERALGEAEGHLKARKRPRWLASLFGE